MTVELDVLVPAPDLRPYLGVFYWLRTATGSLDELERAAPAQLRFRLSPGAARYHFPNGSVEEAPPLHLLGPTTGATRTCAAGPVRVFGVGLTAAGWAALLGSDASSLVNRCVDATALFGAVLDEIAMALRGCGDGAAMVAALEPWLRRQLGGDHDATLTFVRAVEDWLAAHASPALDALAAATALSRRQVERRCNALYGCPPKLLARKHRALRAAAAMAAGEDGLLDGFYDQSHLIREIKQFTGLTPRRLRDGPGQLARLTSAHRRAPAGRVELLVRAT